MIPDNILNYVLTTGPYQGQTIAQAANLYGADGTLNTRLLEEGVFNPSKGINWMGWYLSHHCNWLGKTDWVAADRNEIAAFLVGYKKCYNVEPYITWSQT